MNVLRHFLVRVCLDGLGVRILDVRTLQQKAKLTFPGGGEGYAVDARRGRFYIHYEDARVETPGELRSQGQLFAGNLAV